jgi:hypothetical protein
LISLLGPTDPARWAPWGPKVHVLRHERQGLQTVWPSADEAFALARKLIQP